MSKIATIRARVEPGLKSEVEDRLAHRRLPIEVRIPNALTARTLRESKAGKHVTRLGSKRDLCADLGL